MVRLFFDGCGEGFFNAPPIIIKSLGDGCAFQFCDFRPFS